MPARADLVWTNAELTSVRAGHKACLSPEQIRDRYRLNRSVKAVRTKMSDLGMRSKGQIAQRPILGREPVREDRLLPALLRYGARHRVDLGMGRDAFLAACARHGVRV